MDVTCSPAAEKVNIYRNWNQLAIKKFGKDFLVRKYVFTLFQTGHGMSSAKDQSTWTVCQEGGDIFMRCANRKMLLCASTEGKKNKIEMDCFECDRQDNI